jgi:Memo-like protein
MIVRSALHAGAAYFGDAGRLRASVEAWTEDAAAPRLTGAVCGLIVPRGGHREIGAIAGHAYKVLYSAPQRFDLVTLIAPSDTAAAELRLEPAEAYESPLDLVRIDHALARQLAGAGVPLVEATDEAADIETQLPFVQLTLGDVPMLPLRVGADARVPEALVASASALGLIIVAANLPVSDARLALGHIEALTLDRDRVMRSRRIIGPGGRGLSAWSADLAALALGVRLMRAQGATHVRVLQRAGERVSAVALRV